MTEVSAPCLHGRPVIFGEVLFDEFDDATAVLGGAPFNVAWHLQGFDLQPLLISRVGKDARGDQALETMRGWGMDARGVQINAEHATGQVKIQLDNGQPSFNILANQAYDHIDRDAALAALEGISGALIYHGSLIARSQVAQATLRAVIDHMRVPVFFDINLRKPWWTEELVKGLLPGVRWVKMNGSELSMIAAQDIQGDEQLRSVARDFRQHLDCELLIVTLGEKGALLVTAQDEVSGESPAVDKIIDTVGAGDAFSAVTILGYCRGWSLQKTLRCALQFAAAICRQRGATRRDVDLYRTHLMEWEA